MAMRTRLTAFFGIEHPVISAPMAGAAGGALAAAVSGAGGLGLIGGGYGDPDWLAREFAAAGNAAVGCGFITWSLALRPELLDLALDRAPKAMFLSFGDIAPFAPAVHAAGVPLIAQVQTMAHARAAIDVGAAVIVAQGAEAGGHGAIRGTMTLTPEIADLLAARAPDTLLCAAGGIADGRGLAAALALGADGVVVGSRFWAAAEALVAPGFHRAAIAADGDATVRTSVPDRVRGLDWPPGFTVRVLRSPFTDRWHGDEAGLDAAIATERPRWQAAFVAGDATVANAIVGEAAGLIHDLRPAAEILTEMVAGADAALARAAATCA
ncbi:MAG: nitronate monooxygenase [Paracoccaceae bacterium]|jgi:nitronate monooxygenase